jgi:hypothetical protein
MQWRVVNVIIQNMVIPVRKILHRVSFDLVVLCDMLTYLLLDESVLQSQQRRVYLGFIHFLTVFKFKILRKSRLIGFVIVIILRDEYVTYRISEILS